MNDSTTSSPTLATHLGASARPSNEAMKDGEGNFAAGAPPVPTSAQGGSYEHTSPLTHGHNYASTHPITATPHAHPGADLERQLTSRSGAGLEAPPWNDLNPYTDVPTQDETAFHEKMAHVQTHDPNLVIFTDDDPLNPKNWSRGRRWYITALSGLLVLNATFASSAPSGCIPQIMQELGANELAATGAITTFVGGYCVGPLLWAPMSEIWGRRPLFLVSFFLYTVMNIPAALTPNIGGLLAARFVGGLAASCPLTNSGGVLADIWDPLTLGYGMAIFALAPSAGPVLGPIVGSFVGETVGFRWVFWVLLCFAGVCGILLVFTLPETYGPIILKKKAQKLRKETGNMELYAKIERDDRSVAKVLGVALTRPWKLLLLEPIVLLISIYMSFVYGLLYLIFEAYPIIFVEIHGFSAGVASLAFIGIGVGMLIGTAAAVWFQHRYNVQRQTTGKAVAEMRLPMACAAAPLLVVGMFWLGWTGYRKSIHWISPIMAGAPIGAALVMIFTGFLNYLVDTYLVFAASALAGNTIMRSAFGAGFPMFAVQMFRKLGVEWASSLLGFIALALMPIPFLFVKFGGAIRGKSKFAFS
ncbi:hypothetical protein YB2330_004837 [Saitoella coloradoensis]